MTGGMRWETVLDSPKSVWKRYSVAVLPNLALIAFSYAAGPHPRAPMSFFYLAAAMLSAFYGGLGPGLVSGTISSLAVDYFYTEPIGEVLNTWPSVLMFLVFLGVSAFLSFLAFSLRRAYQEARDSQRKAERAIHSREFTLAAV